MNYDVPIFKREKLVQVSGLGFPSNKTYVKFTPEDYSFLQTSYPEGCLCTTYTGTIESRTTGKLQVNNKSCVHL